jgi:nucleoside-diphosphate-sugar epimerase
MDSHLHVVIGAGPVGSAVTRLLAEQGHQVRLITRAGSPGPDLPTAPGHVQAVAADAADAERLTELARGAEAVYNCANPPYHQWPQLWPPIAAALLTAAERTGAVLVTAGNLYGYGPVDGPMTESTPLAATGTKGRVRNQMWRDALAAHEAGRVRIAEARGSDYLVATANSQLGDRVVPKLLSGRAGSILGDPGATHTWTATTDMARTLVHLAADERAWGRAWHVPSHDPRTPQQVVDELCDLAGVRRVRVRRMPPVLLTLAQPFMPVLREMPEVLHQHTRPWVMDSTAARTELGLQPTPWEQILRDHLAQYRPGPA